MYTYTYMHTRVHAYIRNIYLHRCHIGCSSLFMSSNMTLPFLNISHHVRQRRTILCAAICLCSLSCGIMACNVILIEAHRME